MKRSEMPRRKTRLAPGKGLNARPATRAARDTPPATKPRKRLKPTSRKRQAQSGEYRAAKEKVAERDGYRCQVRAVIDPPWDCFGGITPSHTVKQGRSSARRLDPENLLCVCVGCHERLETHDDWAKEQGLSGSADARCEAGWVIPADRPDPKETTKWPT